jgi:hypothetical protein
LIAISTQSPPGTVLAESRFLARFEIIRKHLSDLFLCNLEKYKNYFEPIPATRAKEFDLIISSFISK